MVEGWHGVPFDRPLQRQRETIEIVRTILRREKLVYDGDVYHLDMGLKLINHPVRSEVPIVLASLGPKNVEMTAELADGWLPVLFSPEKAGAAFGDALAAGAARRSNDLAPLQIMPSLPVSVTDTPEMARTFAKHGLALYLGGMGSRDQNFYNRLFRRYGYEDEARHVQDLYLSRDRNGAAAAVTDAMVDEVSAIGDAEYVADRFRAVREGGRERARAPARGGRPGRPVAGVGDTGGPRLRACAERRTLHGYSALSRRREAAEKTSGARSVTCPRGL